MSVNKWKFYLPVIFLSLFISVNSGCCVDCLTCPECFDCGYDSCPTPELPDGNFANEKNPYRKAVLDQQNGTLTITYTDDSGRAIVETWLLDNSNQ